MAKNSTSSIYWVILPALISMVAAILLFTAGTQPYGEISLGNKTDLTKILLSSRITCLNGSIEKWKLQKDSIIETVSKPTGKAGTATASIPDDAKELIKNIVKAQADIKNTGKELMLIQKGNIDTSLLYFSKYIFIKRDDLLSALDADGWSKVNGYQEKGLKGYPHRHKQNLLELTRRHRSNASTPAE